MSNIDYELKYWDDRLTLPHIDIRDGYCTEGYYKATNDLCMLVDRPYVEFKILCTFSEGLKWSSRKITIKSSSCGLHLRNRWTIELVMKDWRRWECSKIHGGSSLTVVIIIMKWLVFFFNLLNMNLEREWAFIHVDDENLYVWN